MGTIALSSLLPYLFVPRCPEAVRLKALRDGFRRFTKDTVIWKEDITVPTVADQAAYLVVPSIENAMVRFCQTVTLDGSIVPNSQFEFSGAEVLTLSDSRTPDAGGLDMVVSVVCVALPACTEGPDWILKRWGSTIAHAAAVALKSDPGGGPEPVPWFSDHSASISESKYRADLFDANLEELDCRQAGSFTIDIPEF